VEVWRIGVVGLGTMGSGIAQVCAAAGLDVVGVDPVEGAPARARERISGFLGRRVEKGTLTAEERDAQLERLGLDADLDMLSSCDVVIEAIVEELDAKQELFARVAEVVSPWALLATNTSALSVSAIAARVEQPERVVGMHFFNPAPLLPLVEVVRGERSSDEAVDRAVALAKQLGKEPVVCNDTPGFVVNRILIPLLNDCVRVLDDTGVSPEDLDRAMRFGLNWPIGPCALVDLIGIDVHVHASEALHDALAEERMAPPERLLRMRDAGELGRKSGRGFFAYDA
jgi:3-hydroxybutyryl-CoA dehydrogenase